MEDEVLVRASQQGSLEAFNELVLKYQDQVYSLASYILNNPALAEDITQETFIKAFQRLNQYRGTYFRAWLLKIAKNNCYDELRSWKHLSHQDLEPVDREGKVNESPKWLIDHLPRPEEVVEASELQGVIEKGLSQLRPPFRTVVILVDIHQMDYTETARVTGIPVGTVKSRLARGRMQLREFLSEFAKPYLPEAEFPVRSSGTEYFQGLQSG